MSDNENVDIPDEAVEALARLIAEEAFFADPSDDGWNANLDSSDHYMPRSRITARIYLEAAAPHMQATRAYTPQEFDCECTTACEHPKAAK